MVDVLEARARHADAFFIPAVLPPRLALNPHPRRSGDSKGSVDITIKKGDGSLETFYGRVTSFNLDQEKIEVSIRGRGDSYAHVRQADGMTEIWFDRSESVQQRQTPLSAEHPVFEHIIRRLGPLIIEVGMQGESQAYANLGETDFLGFLRNRPSINQRLVRVDRAA